MLFKFETSMFSRGVQNLYSIFRRLGWKHTNKNCNWWQNTDTHWHHFWHMQWQNTTIQLQKQIRMDMATMVHHAADKVDWL